MGLSRRQFTKEFKLAAVRRLEAGVSLAEVARGLEVNPNVLQRWRRETSLVLPKLFASLYQEDGLTRHPLYSRLTVTAKSTFRASSGVP